MRWFIKSTLFEKKAFSKFESKVSKTTSDEEGIGPPCALLDIPLEDW